MTYWPRFGILADLGCSLPNQKRNFTCMSFHNVGAYAKLSMRSTTLSVHVRFAKARH